MSNSAKMNQVESDTKINIFREKRIEIPENIESKVIIEIDHTEMVGKVKNISEFGVRVLFSNPSILLTTNTNINIISVDLDGTLIYKGSCKIVDDKESDGILSAGFFLKGSQINLENVKSLLTINDKKDSFLKQNEALDLAEHIQTEFKVLCSDLVHLFTKIRETLDHEDKKIKLIKDNKDFYDSIVEHTTELAMALFADKIRKSFEKFENVVKDFDSSQHLIHKTYFRSIFHPILLNTPFVQRAYEKPLGYAGDYGLMLMFYEFNNMGNSLFDQFIHKYACNEPSAVANQNRVKFLSTLLATDIIKAKTTNQNFKITSVACGPAMEMRLTIEKLLANGFDKKIDLILLDQESEALDYSQKKIKLAANGSENIKCIPIKDDAVMGIIKKANFSRLLDNSNAIVSAGLFDYLSDRVSTKMIERLYEKLIPGGILLIGNVSDISPDRFSMNYLMEWNLFLRSPECLKKLVPKTIIEQGAKVEVIHEPLGINLFLRIKKDAQNS